MKLEELFEIWGERGDRQAEVDWHNDVSNSNNSPQLYCLKNKKGQTVRSDLTLAAAKASQTRKDLIKKHGTLSIRPI